LLEPLDRRRNLLWDLKWKELLDTETAEVAR